MGRRFWENLHDASNEGWGGYKEGIETDLEVSYAAFVKGVMA